MQKNKALKKTTEERAKELRIKNLVSEIEEDFEKKRRERKPLERQWELNMNFLFGNQYCSIDGRNEIVKDEKSFYWQTRGVFNHIAPIMETRTAKLARVNPVVSVRPKSDDDDDVINASLAEKLISGAFSNCDIESVVKRVTSWSETCGSAFYKVVWDNYGGEEIGVLDGSPVYEGDAKIIAVSPFEIFPDNLSAERIEDLSVIIHAVAMPVTEIYEKYGVQVEGEDLDVLSINGESAFNLKTEKPVVKNSAIVIERYEKASSIFPNGRLVTVAGGHLLYEGELPYIDNKRGDRGFPFIKQDSIEVSGRFFGTSVIERLIPVQRAYNAVKNRKHEFLNRLSMGVMTVEDGSVDVDDLQNDGLCPGKVLVYRQGSAVPEMMKETALPPDFNDEEEKLLAEFVAISGVSDVSSSSENARLSSGSALELLIEQDNTRLTVTAENIRRCYLEIARKILRLYSQFIAGVKAVKYEDTFNKVKVCYADKKTASSDDVYLENENELMYTPAEKREMIFKLYNSGILSDDNGKLRPTTKEKVLSLLGYKDLDYKKGLARLQEEKARNENDKIRKTGLDTEDIDDDGIHIDEHVRYILSEYDELSAAEKERLFAHVKAHREKLSFIEQVSYPDKI